MISAVLFDLDETLLDRTTSLVAFLADQYRRFAGRLGRVSFDAWRDRFLVLDARGHIGKSVVYPVLLEEFGGDLAATDALLVDYRERCCEHARGFPGMAATLSALRSRGLKLGIVTNGETEFQARHIDVLGLAARVDAVLISEAEGLRKPDRALFLRAADRLDVRVAECLFVGDNPAVDILGADAAGMPTAWFRNGAAWPHDLAHLPGPAIDSLDQILGLVGIDAR
jgi:putative hydrolase of the HAD superfamily